MARGWRHGATPTRAVTRGLNCIKGYFLSKIMHGKDRATAPLLRKKDGRYDKDGEFVPVGWDEALDLLAAKWKEAPKSDGPGAVGMFGPGQWTIWKGCAEAKPWKAGFRSNDIDPNARRQGSAAGGVGGVAVSSGTGPANRA